jgi:aldose 1-epimerase
MIAVHHLLHEDSAGKTSAIVVPDWGANVLAFSYRAAGWQWPVPVLEAVDFATVAMAPTFYGAPLLGPTPGRVGTNQNGRFIWRGGEHSIAPTRHGWLRGAAWTVEDAAPDRLVCTARFRPDPERCTLPFDFSARHEVTLTGARLQSRVTLTNRGDIDVPLDLGWHPYLHREGRCRAVIPAAHIWELNDAPEPTPTGKLLPVSGELDFRTGREIAAGEHWDNIFHTLATDADGWSHSWVEAEETVALSDGAGQVLTLRRGVSILVAPSTPGMAPVRNMQLFTPPDRRAISLEPLSAPPDALNLLARGVDEAAPNIMPPGAESSFEMVISLSTCVA